MKRFKRLKYGLDQNPVGKFVSFTLRVGDKAYLGEVIDVYNDDVTGSIRLKVKHFNGAMWPLDPPAVNVEIID